MPTTLSTPEVRQAVTTATLDHWEIDVSRSANLSVDTAKTIFSARVILRDGTGAEIDRRTFRRDFASLPAGIRTKIGDLHAALVTALKAAGVIPAGTDTADL